MEKFKLGTLFLIEQGALISIAEVIDLEIFEEKALAIITLQKFKDNFLDVILDMNNYLYLFWEHCDGIILMNDIKFLKKYIKYRNKYEIELGRKSKMKFIINFGGFVFDENCY